MKQGQRIRLIPKTRHGKNRIHQHGDEWVVINVGKFRGQDAVNLRSIGKTFKVGEFMQFDGRWVLFQNDPDFEILGVDIGVI
ncbi:MAG: hypothetical protein CMA64_06525 [Euryarchaeota archaeon]|nr:hypothetical protein [Euryarchaeota archaeon]